MNHTEGYPVCGGSGRIPKEEKTNYHGMPASPGDDGYVYRQDDEETIIGFRTVENARSDME